MPIPIPNPNPTATVTVTATATATATAFASVFAFAFATATATTPSTSYWVGFFEQHFDISRIRGKSRAHAGARAASMEEEAPPHGEEAGQPADAGKAQADDADTVMMLECLKCGFSAEEIKACQEATPPLNSLINIGTANNPGIVNKGHLKSVKTLLVQIGNRFVDRNPSKPVCKAAFERLDAFYKGTLSHARQKKTKKASVCHAGDAKAWAKSEGEALRKILAWTWRLRGKTEKSRDEDLLEIKQAWTQQRPAASGKPPQPAAGSSSSSDPQKPPMPAAGGSSSSGPQKPPTKKQLRGVNAKLGGASSDVLDLLRRHSIQETAAAKPAVGPLEDTSAAAGAGDPAAMVVVGDSQPSPAAELKVEDSQVDPAAEARIEDSQVEDIPTAESRVEGTQFEDNAVASLSSASPCSVLSLSSFDLEGELGHTIDDQSAKETQTLMPKSREPAGLQCPVMCEAIIIHVVLYFMACVND